MTRLTIFSLCLLAVLVATQPAPAQGLEARLADPTIAGAVHALTPVAARPVEPTLVGQAIRSAGPQSVPGLRLPNRFMLGMIVAGAILAVGMVALVRTDHAMRDTSRNVESSAAAKGGKSVELSLRF